MPAFLYRSKPDHLHTIVAYVGLFWASWTKPPKQWWTTMGWIQTWCTPTFAPKPCYSCTIQLHFVNVSVCMAFTRVTNQILSIHTQTLQCPPHPPVHHLPWNAVKRVSKSTNAIHKSFVFIYLSWSWRTVFVFHFLCHKTQLHVKDLDSPHFSLRNPLQYLHPIVSAI